MEASTKNQRVTDTLGGTDRDSTLTGITDEHHNVLLSVSPQLVKDNNFIRKLEMEDPRYNRTQREKFLYDRVSEREPRALNKFLLYSS